MEEVTKCSYINCSDVQEREQIFHELPVCDTSLCVKWLINSGHEDLLRKDFSSLRSMKFFVCNNHFTNDCYLAKGTLKDNAVPQAYWKSNIKKKDSLRTYHFSNGQNINLSNPDNSREYTDLWCRTCATKKTNLVGMTVKNKKTQMSLLSKLKLLIEIDDEDILPLNMCLECVTKLEQSFQFFQQIYIADNTLRHVFAKPQTNIHDYNGISNERGKHHVKIKDDLKISEHALTKHESAMHAPIVNSPLQTKLHVNNNPSKHSSFVTTDADSTQGTVFSLLTDTCHSDEELDWSDVLKVMKHEQSIESQSKPIVDKTRMCCEFCDAKFKLRRQLKTHLVIDHLKHIDKMCMDCIVSYKNKSLLVEHRIRYHNDKRYKCDHCLKDFFKKSKLRQHIKKKHFQVEYSCEMCDKKFAAKNIIAIHIRDCHMSVEDNALREVSCKDTVAQSTCSSCHQPFDGAHCSGCNNDHLSLESIQRKNNLVDSEQFNSTHCPECNIDLCSTEKLRIHEMQSHLSKKNDFTCLLCKINSFHTTEEYEEHIDQHCKHLKTHA